MENISKVIENILNNNLIKTIIAIFIGVFVYELLRKIILHHSKNNKNSKISNRNQTYLRLLVSVIKYAIIIITILIILQINGVDISSLVAGAGILGIVVGFAVQDALKDIIRGATIIADSYYSVGDVILYGDFMGKVISIGLTTTKVEDLITGNILSIANRNIEQIQVVSESVDIMVPLPYELKIDKAEEIVNEIAEQVRQISDIKLCEYKGVSKFKDSNIDYYLNFHCNPIVRRKMMRNVNGIILRVLEKHNVSIPYNQLDIHQK